jgi:subtilisin family serine protease/subtilisin-like proprotein convertase family protein
MRNNPRLWALISVLLLIASAVFWRLGEWDENRRVKPLNQPPSDSTTSTSNVNKPLTNSLEQINEKQKQQKKPELLAMEEKLYPYRLRNTDKRLDELLKSPNAIILQNALIDTTAGKPLPIPSTLRADKTRTFIVQARGNINDVIRNGIKMAGGTIISYIPNNSYLVRSKSDDPAVLARIPGVQAVVAYEPYFKLSSELLDVINKWSAETDSLKMHVLGYEGERDELRKSLENLGAQIIAEQKNPFGPQFTIEAGINVLTDIARSDFVQIVEKVHLRATANDRSRVLVGASFSLTNQANPLGLTGSNVLVNINDTGVDASHPDLAGRVTAENPGLLTDRDGHGTHVAGTIAGDGTMSYTVKSAPGSPANSNFRGMAPGARLFVMGANPVVGPLTTDEVMQRGAARTNARISNNSWFYIGDFTYSLSAASFDMAVRDSLPEEPGMQGLIYVFAAGNRGSGDPYGAGGSPNTITAPATAKNVITVGAIESARKITNQVVIGTETNAPFVAMTDSDDQVAAYSGRGNVGVANEGIFGRFKPDVVAPGTFVISTRSQQYQEPTNNTSSFANYIRNLYVQPLGTNTHTVYVPQNADVLIIQITPNSSSPDPFPTLAIEADPGTNATTFRGNNIATIDNPAEGNWLVDVINSSQMTVSYDLRIIIALNDQSGALNQVVSSLNSELGPWYRFETGTSMSAGVVSGVLALLEEFYTQRGHTNSPAMMKALLINGARRLGPNYDYAVKNYVNHQGWGLINLTNSARASMTPGSESSWTIQVFDQDPTNAIVTGMTHTRLVSASPATNKETALRITLVWTDPPGNPAAGLKLVNDLDLVVTNLATGEVYVGNNFEQAGIYSVPYVFTTNSTNAVLEYDYVNNVENVFIKLNTNAAQFSVSVVGRRVNVNAVTAHPDGIAQDYALVISVDEGGSLSVNPPPSSPPQITMDPTPFIKSVTNGVAMVRERVGANSPLLVYTNGMTNQWNFYVFTNAPVITSMMVGTNLTYMTNNVGSNIMFITFIPPNISRPRATDADIDLYVSKNPALTNLDANVIWNETFKSIKRGGTEAVIVTNAVVGSGEVYYIGVKSEDQQGAEFGLYVNSSDNPFYNTDQQGNYILSMSCAIPDGTADQPGAGLGFAVMPQSVIIRRLVVTNILVHENPGDVLENLSHGDNYVVLNNHSFESKLPPPSPVTLMWIYEDNDEGDIPDSQHPDGPGSLRDFVGDDAVGAWQLTAIDSAWWHTGMVQSLTIRIEPSDTNMNNLVYVDQTVLPGRLRFYPVNVPVCATNMHVVVGNNNGPLFIFIRAGNFPTTNLYDISASIPANGGELQLSIWDSPPLSPGQYIVGIYNPDTGNAVNFNLRIYFDFDPNCKTPLTDFGAFDNLTFFDDATTNTGIFVPISRQIADVQVGVIIDHPRSSDLVLHLISPQGTRVLLAENRGGPTNANYGIGQFTTNIVPRSSSGGPAEDRNIIGTATNMGFVRIDYDFYTIPDTLRIYYDGNLLYDSGLVAGSNSVLVSFGPGLSTNIEIVINEGNNSNGGTLWQYVATILSGQIVYTTFTENTNLAKVPIKFAPPPFTKTNFVTMEQSFLGGFETNTLPQPTNQFWVDYPQGSVIDGWEVVSNQVAVVTDTNIAVSGTSFLALGNGVIRRTLPTVGGHTYRMVYITRDPGIVSWWSGITLGNQAVDAFGLNNGVLTFGATVVGAGQVGEAFNFRGGTNADRILIPDRPTLSFTNSFTIEGWVNILTNDGGIIFFRGDNRPGLDPYLVATDGTNGIYFQITDASNNTYAISAPVSNGWHHFGAVLCDSDSSVRLYIDGNEAAVGYTAIRPFANLDINSEPGVAIGNHAGTILNQPFSGLIDEIAVYNRALSGAEIKGIYDIGSQGKSKCSPYSCMPSASIYLDGALLTNHVMYGQGWATNFLTFTATNDNSVIEIEGSPMGLLFDSFYLFDISDSVYYLPEEPLSALYGQNSYGLWRLEIWDNRVGQVLTNGHLISWRLQLGFVNTNYGIITLTNHQPYTGTLYTNNVHYFAVDAPLGILSITNSILNADAPVTVVFNQTELPLPGRPGNVILMTGVTNGVFILDTNSVPALVTGQRYYLAVYSTSAATSTNTYTIQIDWDITTPAPLQLNVISSSGVMWNGSINHIVTIPAGTVAASFELLGLNGGASMKIGYAGADESSQWMSKSGTPQIEYIFSTSTTDSSDKQIVVTTNNFPFLTNGGLWVISVKNEGGGILEPKVRVVVSDKWTPGQPVKPPAFVAPPSFIKGVGTILNFDTDIGRKYRVMVSDDLVEWQILNETTATAVITTVVDMTPPEKNRQRFYRIVPSEN